MAFLINPTNQFERSAGMKPSRKAVKRVMRKMVAIKRDVASSTASTASTTRKVFSAPLAGGKK